MVYSLQVRNGELVRKTMSIPTYRPGKKFAFIMNLLYYGPKPINQPSEEKLIVFKMPELMRCYGLTWTS